GERQPPGEFGDAQGGAVKRRWRADHRGGRSGASSRAERSEPAMSTSIALSVCLALSTAPPAEKGKPAADALRPEAGWKELGEKGSNLWFDLKGNRVILRARVVLREGVLEHLMCKKGTKEHEAILATTAPPRLIHAGLLLTGAETGHPVQFVPKFEPPAGTAIAIEFLW